MVADMACKDHGTFADLVSSIGWKPLVTLAPCCTHGVRLLPETLQLSAWGRDRGVLEGLLAECAASYEADSRQRTIIHSMDADGYWCVKSACSPGILPACARGWHSTRMPVDHVDCHLPTLFLIVNRKGTSWK
jgi:hypothetical protein